MDKHSLTPIEAESPIETPAVFENTEIAFRNKSDADLTRAYLLFKAINSKWLTTVSTAAVRVCLKLNLPIQAIVKATLFKQFCGGETADECETTIQALAQSGIKAILDYSAEGTKTESGFDTSLKIILDNIERAKKNPNIPFAVYKTSGIARVELLEKVSSGKALSVSETGEFERIRARVNLICKAGFEAGVPIMVDAEESWVQPAVDQMVTEMMQMYNRQKCIVANTLQMYRTDRLAYLKAVFAQAEQGNYFLGVKIVRGAYLEQERERASRLGYPSPVSDTKAETDQNYNGALEFCMAHLDRILLCAGTHNEQSNLYLIELISTYQADRKNPNLYFSQLYGMGDHISYNLSQAGYNVAKYVPYGPVLTVLPYLIRRAEENTSIAGLASRDLRLIIKEKKRRRMKGV